jgi:hypothetical protein
LALHSARALVALAVIGPVVSAALVQLTAMIAGIVLVAVGGFVAVRRLRRRRVAA